MARRLGDEGTLAHVLSRANFIDITAEAARRGSRDEHTRCSELARQGRRPRAGAALARDCCCATTSQLGDIAAVDRELTPTPGWPRSCASPSTSGTSRCCAAMRAMIDGRFEEAEQLAAEARRRRRGGRRAAGAAVLRDPGVC